MNRAPFTNRLARELEVGLLRRGEGGADILVGRDRPPARANLPYVILYALEGGAWIGPPANLEADATLIYQVKGVAKRSKDGDDADELGVETLGDLCRAIMLKAGNGVPGITVMRRYSLAMGGTQSDDRVLNFDERFAYLVTTS